jgi:hypothetical protein
MPESEGYYAFVLVLVGEFTLEDVVTNTRFEWEPWASISPVSYNQVIVEDNRFIQEVILPEFLPNDETYTMIILFLDPDDPDFSYHWNYVHVRPGESVGSEDEQNFFLQSPIKIGNVGIPWLAIIIIIVLILAAVVAGAKRRGAKPRVQQSDQYPSQFYSGAPSEYSYQRSYPQRYKPQPRVTQRDYTRGDRPSSSPQVIFQEEFEEPYQQRDSRQPRIYQRDYAQADRSLPPHRIISRQAYEQPYQERYSRQPRVYQKDYMRSRQYSPPHPQPKTVKSAYSRRDTVISVRCSACRNEFYVQGKTPPFKTNCPYCSKDNIVV